MNYIVTANYILRFRQEVMRGSLNIIHLKELGIDLSKSVKQQFKNTNEFFLTNITSALCYFRNIFDNYKIYKNEAR